MTYEEDEVQRGAEGSGEDVSPHRSSILGSLKDRRREIAESEHLTLSVPRWNDPEIVVRFKPLEHETIRSIQGRVSKAPKKEQGRAEVRAHVDLLIRACDAVIARIDDESYSLRPGDPHGEPTLFDKDLAENLGLDDGATARDVVQALYITHGDIISAANQVVRFSGYNVDAADEAILGE